MTSLQPTMLWENTDPAIALTKRFQFTTPEAAVEWLSDTVTRTYGVEVASVDRLVMSAYNLLAWLTTDDGPLLAKCCAYLPAHQRLQHAAELVVWLAQESLPVSAPLVSQAGALQVSCGHLSLGVQRLISGDLLEPTQFPQAEAAGATLAQLHHALAKYPRATDFVSDPPVPSLTTLIEKWLQQKAATLTAPDLVTSSTVLMAQAMQLATTPLAATQLVHGDYRAANILWYEGQIRAVLDFEEVRWGYRVNDLAWAAAHLGTRYHHWGPVSPEVHRTFLNSYAAVHPLSEQEQQWLLPLITWHSLVLAAASAGRPTYAAGIDVVNFYTELLQSDMQIGSPPRAQRNH